ncbi:MAG: XRE family transcriptional regulator [Pacificimonas sp.]
MSLAALTDGLDISVDLLVAQLRTTKRELGETIGVAPEALSRRSRRLSPSIQMQLRHLVEILNMVSGQFGNLMMAYAWYRSEPLIGFGGRTPEEIAKDGNFDGLRAHILRRLNGGFA